MGDRSNILFKGPRDAIGVYAHRDGVRVAEAAMVVLGNEAFQKRLGDDAYAMRIGVQTVLEFLGSSSKSDTGYDLWTKAMGPCDNSYGIVTVDVMTGSVSVNDKVIKTPTAEKIATAMK